MSEGYACRVEATAASSYRVDIGAFRKVSRLNYSALQVMVLGPGENTFGELPWVNRFLAAEGIIRHELNYWVDFENKYESWFNFHSNIVPTI